MTMEHFDRSFEVSLHILHPTFNPAEATATLGLEPTKSVNAGPPRKPPFDLAACWHRFDCHAVRELVPFLEEVADRLDSNRDFLLSLTETGGEVELFCGIMASFNWDEAFPASLMGRLASLGIDLRLDVYPKDRVFVVQHEHTGEGGNENVKFIGVYRTLESAKEAVERLRHQPGFRDYPRIVEASKDDDTDGFHITECEIGKDHWPEGFISWAEAMEESNGDPID